jgi:hypothetical protein
VIADHEGSCVAPQEVVDGRVEPALVPELETMPSRRQLLESRSEALVIPVEVARELPQSRPELGRLDERLDPLVEALEPTPEVGEGFMCVRYRLALTAKRNPGGLCSTHPWTAARVGSR